MSSDLYYLKCQLKAEDKFANSVLALETPSEEQRTTQTSLLTFFTIAIKSLEKKFPEMG